MENSRTADDETDTRPSCHVSIDTGCITAGLLVAEGDESNTQVDRFLCNLDDGYADDAKYHCDPKVAQGARDKLSTCFCSHSGAMETFLQNIQWMIVMEM
jgi:hypothetical protein